MESNTGTQVDWETGKQVGKYIRNPLVYLFTCVLVYLFIGSQYAALTPRWQVPDEPAHYNYIRELVEKRALPVLDPGEYQQAYLEELKSQRFPAELSIETINYESWQPPLYYLLAAPVYAASNGDLLTLRLFSLLIGAGVIIFAYLTIREAMPDKPWVAVVAAGFIAFIPQHIAMLAGINNDSLSELVIAVGLWLIVKGNNGTAELRRENKGTWVLGAVVAAALVTKSQAYVLVPVAGVMLLFRWWRGRSQKSATENLKALISSAVIIFLPALLIGLLWWGRNIATYGWPDFMAAIRHDQVVSDQPRTGQWLAEYGTTEVLRRFFQTTFQSFWGQFGWMGVVMPDRYYAALLGYTVFLIMGFLLSFKRLEIRRSAWRLSSNLQSPVSNYYLLITSSLLTLGLYLYYNLIYVQHQGRYLFPALVPIGLAASLSLWEWGRLLETVTKRKIGWLVPVGALAGMAALSTFALYRFILPALT